MQGELLQTLTWFNPNYGNKINIETDHHMMENRQHRLSDCLLPLQWAELAELVTAERHRQPERVEVLLVAMGDVIQTAPVTRWVSAWEWELAVSRPSHTHAHTAVNKLHQDYLWRHE